MVVEENKRIVQGYFEDILIKKDFDAIDKYFASELTFNGEPLSRERFAEFLHSLYLKPFPDFHPTIEDQIAVDDRVVTRVYLQGTHKSEFQGIAPTFKKVKTLGIAIDRIVDGKVKEMWHEADFWGLVKQLKNVKPTTEIPRLGHHFEICISVDSLPDSIAFYQKLGFNVYSGGPDKGWCTLTDGIIYLALFSDNFIEKEFGIPVLFNYRGGNVKKIVDYLKTQGVEFSREKAHENGTGSAIFTDPNGRVFFFDTAEKEERIDISNNSKS